MKRWYVNDVMTTEVATVTPDAGSEEVTDLLVRRGLSAVPVIDGERRVLGIVSEGDVLAKLARAARIPHHPLTSRRIRSGRRDAAGSTAGELMTSPAVTIEATGTVTRAARLMDAARVKRLPVLDGAGRLVGIVARRDLLRLYTRTDEQLRATIVNDLLGALWIDPRTVQVRVRSGIVTLTGRLDRRSTASIAITVTLGTPGVVDVVNELTFEVDDGDPARAVFRTGGPGPLPAVAGPSATELNNPQLERALSARVGDLDRIIRDVRAAVFALDPVDPVRPADAQE